MNVRFQELAGLLLVGSCFGAACMYADPSTTKPAAESNVPAPSKFNQTTTGTEKEDKLKPKPLFQGWEKPEVVLVISGQQYGYVEPCGCTGLENQKGGLARRHTFLRDLAAKNWTIVPLDAGNQVRRYGRQAELQFQLTANALKFMDYRGIGLGADDVRLSAGELLSPIANDGAFLSANVAVLDRKYPQQFRLFEAGGKKFAVTSVMGESQRKQITSSEILHQDAVAALKEIAPQILAAKCDYRILMASATEQETRAYAASFPDYDLVVHVSGSGEPAYEPETLEGTKGLLVRTGAKGMYLVALGLFADQEHPVRYERVPLDARFQDSPDMLELMAQYQQQLEGLGFTDLGVKPQPHPARQRFVGSKVCGDCHTKAFEVWEKTKHAHATDSLVHPQERANIPRHFDPECLSCHVTGWSPQGFHPYLGGYSDLKLTPELTQNGCENCHGPGSEHVAAENGGAKADVPRFREAMKLSLQPAKPGEKSPAEKKCMTCHDLDNSPDFHAENAFQKYWKDVAHKGKD